MQSLRFSLLVFLVLLACCGAAAVKLFRHEPVWFTPCRSLEGPTFLVDGELLVPTRKALLALDPETGSVLWQIAGDFASVAPMVVEDRLIVVTSRYDVVAYDKTTRRQLWTVDDAIRTFNTTRLPIADGMLYTSEFNLRAHDTQTGNEVWRDEAPRFRKAIIPHEGVLYYTGHSYSPHDRRLQKPDSLFAFDVRTQELLWQTELAHDSFGYYPVVHEDAVFIAEDDPSTRSTILRVFNRHTGNQLWKSTVSQAPGYRMIFPPLTAKGLLIVVNDRGLYRAFDWKLGTLKWQAQGKMFETRLKATIADGELLLVDRDQVRRHDVTNGSLIGTIKLKPRQLAMGIEYHNGRIYISTLDGVACYEKP